MYSLTTHLMAKYAICSLAKVCSIDECEYDLNLSEVCNLLFSLFAAAKESSDCECNSWEVFTLTVPLYLHYLLQICCYFSLSEQNAKLFSENEFKNEECSLKVFDVLSIILDCYSHVDLVTENALLYLEIIGNGAQGKLNIPEIYPKIKSAIENILSSSTSQDILQNVHFCMLALGLKIAISGMNKLSHTKTN